MAITLMDVRARLEPDEVDYLSARKLGPQAIPFLMELVQGGDLALASKAAYLASMILSPRSAAVLEKAAASQEAVVRVAAASAIRNLSAADAEKVMDLMKNDPDAGVRKVVLKSVSLLKSRRLSMKAKNMAQEDPEPFIRDLARGPAKGTKKKK